MGKTKRRSTVIPEDSQALEKLNAELKREIEERVRTEKALKESEERYRTILETIQENSPDVIYRLDPDWASSCLMELSRTMGAESGLRTMTRGAPPFLSICTW